MLRQMFDQPRGFPLVFSRCCPRFELEGSKEKKIFLQVFPVAVVEFEVDNLITQQTTGDPLV